MKIAVMLVFDTCSTRYEIYEITKPVNGTNHSYKKIKKIGGAWPSVADQVLPINVIAALSISRKLMVFKNKKSQEITLNQPQSITTRHAIGILFQTRANIKGSQVIRRLLKINSVPAWTKRTTKQKGFEICMSLHASRVMAALDVVGNHLTVDKIWINPKYLPLFFTFANKYPLEVFARSALKIFVKIPPATISRAYLALKNINESKVPIDMTKALENPSLENLEKLAGIQKLLEKRGNCNE